MNGTVNPTATIPNRSWTYEPFLVNPLVRKLDGTAATSRDLVGVRPDPVQNRVGRPRPPRAVRPLERSITLAQHRPRRQQPHVGRARTGRRPGRPGPRLRRQLGAERAVPEPEHCRPHRADTHRDGELHVISSNRGRRVAPLRHEGVRGAGGFDSCATGDVENRARRVGRTAVERGFEAPARPGCRPARKGGERVARGQDWEAQ